MSTCALGLRAWGLGQAASPPGSGSSVGGAVILAAIDSGGLPASFTQGFGSGTGLGSDARIPKKPPETYLHD